MVNNSQNQFAENIKSQSRLKHIKDNGYHDDLFITYKMQNFLITCPGFDIVLGLTLLELHSLNHI